MYKETNIKLCEQDNNFGKEFGRMQCQYEEHIMKLNDQIIQFQVIKITTLGS